MVTPKYVSAIMTICFGIAMIPGVDTVILGILIFFVLLISLLVNLLFLWKPLRRLLYKELLSEFYLNFYKNDDFVDFLVAKRGTRRKQVDIEK